MRVLDLFCGAGGAAMGLHRAWPDAEIVGVDVNPQPRYPFMFVQGDALGYPVAQFDFIWASPPCQFATSYKRRPDHVAPSANLIPATRSLLSLTEAPCVIENITGARLELRDPIMLCGSMFGLDVRRHRLFECSFPVFPPPCDHKAQTPRFPPATNRTNLRSTVEVGVWRIPLEVQQKAMGIDWMNPEELSQAIPPAYSEFLARALDHRRHHVTTIIYTVGKDTIEPDQRVSDEYAERFRAACETAIQRDYPDAEVEVGYVGSTTSPCSVHSDDPSVDECAIAEGVGVLTNLIWDRQDF